MSQARASGDTEPWNPTRCRGNKHVGEYHCPRESSPLKRSSRDVSSAFIVKGHLSMHLSMRRTGWQKDDASEGCVLPLGRVCCWDHESSSVPSCALQRKTSPERRRRPLAMRIIAPESWAHGASLGTSRASEEQPARANKKLRNRHPGALILNDSAIYSG